MHMWFSQSPPTLWSPPHTTTSFQMFKTITSTNTKRLDSSHWFFFSLPCISFLIVTLRNIMLKNTFISFFHSILFPISKYWLTISVRKQEKKMMLNTMHCMQSQTWSLLVSVEPSFLSWRYPYPLKVMFCSCDKVVLLLEVMHLTKVKSDLIRAAVWEGCCFAGSSSGAKRVSKGWLIM